MNRSGIGVKLLAVSIVAVLAMTAYYAVEGADDNDVIILFTGDVHCAYGDNIGYDGLSAYKYDMEEKYNNVMLVDTGDFLQGDVVGIVSNGALLVNAMNRLDYDMVTIGNHDFDYGADNLWNLLRNANFQTICCNVSYIGEKQDPLDFMQPFTIRQFDNVRIGFIGVTTPSTYNTTSPEHLMEDGEYVYDFHEENDGKELYGRVQNSIDACKALGATHIVLLSHLGDSEYPPYTSVDVAENTSGISCILDGHQHNIFSDMKVKDKSGHDVQIASTGTKLENIGCLKITQNGKISIDLVNTNDYTKKDPEFTRYNKIMDAWIEEKLGVPLFELPFDLPNHNADGARTVRNQETIIGNVIADAYRIEMDADIALFGGGGVRDSLYKGDVSLNDILEVMPFLNSTSVVKVKGQTILDCLEMSCHLMTAETSEGSTALGEFGGFQSVSGIKFKVDTSIDTPVLLDDKGNFIGIKEGVDRRVSDVKVLDRETGTYVDIDVDNDYTVAGTDFLLNECGDGFTMFKDATVILKESTLDCVLFTNYMTGLTQEQMISLYSTTDGRIVRI